MAQEYEQKPPTSWYGAIAFLGKAIKHVALGTEIFLAIHPDLNKRIAIWANTSGVVHPTTEELAIIAKEATFIQSVTGFHPRKLYNYAHQLEEIYRGQSMGPFPFPEVVWIE